MILELGLREEVRAALSFPHFSSFLLHSWLEHLIFRPRVKSLGREGKSRMIARSHLEEGWQESQDLHVSL